jgi:HK97 family phage portal protein
LKGGGHLKRLSLIDKLKIVNSANFGLWFSEFVKGDDDGQNQPFNVTSDVALNYSAVFACTRVLSETAASLPLKLYKSNGESRDEARETRLYDILHNAPNAEMTPFNFKECMMTSLCLGGNAFAQKLLNKKKEIIGLNPIEWQKITVERDKETGKLQYKIQNGIESPTKTRDEIFHIPGLSLNGINGLTPIGYAAKAIELGLTYENFCINFYKNGANTNMALIHPSVLKKEAEENLRKQVDEKQTGLRNVNRPWLLQEGMQIKELTINPVDAQLLESKRFQTEEICRMYRVPLHLVQDLSRSTNNNIEHQSLEFVMYTMLPWFKRWEENINLQLLTPEERKEGYYAEFKIDALLRGDAKSRADAYAVGREWGWLSVNDIRRLENMNGIGAKGDIYIQPLNYIEAGKEPTADEQNANTKAMAEEIFKMISERK